MANKFGHKYVFSALIFSSVLISDQISKYYFASVCNPGMAFGLILPFGRFNTVLNFAVLLGVLYLFVKQRVRLRYTALVLILSGGVSNLSDRIMLGCVRDFIDLGFWPSLTWLSPSLTRWPSFNLADSAISIGVAIIVYKIALKIGQSNDLNH